MPAEVLLAVVGDLADVVVLPANRQLGDIGDHQPARRRAWSPTRCWWSVVANRCRAACRLIPNSRPTAPHDSPSARAVATRRSVIAASARPSAYTAKSPVWSLAVAEVW